MINSKKKVLDEFLFKFKDLPAQSSKEWLKSRSETIGGSEISTILGLNPYQKVKQLIEQKTGLTTFKKSAALWHGNIFEPILQLYTEKIFDTKVYETGSLPYEKSNLIKYSPDGLAIIKLNKLKKYLKGYNLEDQIYNKSLFNKNEKNELLVLLEFKNPYMRILKEDIPVYYVPQPRLGMQVIDIAEVSIFIESVFRFCSYSDIINLNNKYNRFYHFDRVPYINTPICYGTFSLYYKKDNNSTELANILFLIEEYFKSNNYNKEYNLGNNILNKYDLSKIKTKDIINKVMENIIDYKDIKVIYHNIYINDPEYHKSNELDVDNNDLYYFNTYNNNLNFNKEIHKIKNDIESDSENIYMGIMSYKMFDINIKPVFKNNPLTNEVLKKIEKVVDIIKKCNLEDDIQNKKNIIKQFC